jgi:predicted dehydrogenase
MRTVVVGAGRMGQRHVQVVRELGLELVGLCDRFPAALESAASNLKLAPQLLLSDPVQAMALKPECVIVATTAPAHADFTCFAAEAGARYILCEKPMAVSLAQCERMLSVCQRFKTHLAINHQMRFMEQYTLPKQLLISPDFGGLTGVQVTAGNFGLAMNGTHYFEMFRFLADEDPQEVSAWFTAETVPNPRGPEFVDRAGCVRAVTVSGKRFYIDCSADQGHGMLVTYTARHGHIVVDELGGTMAWTHRKAEHRGQPTTRYGMPWDHGTRTIAPADAVAPTRSVLQALLARNDYPTGEQGRLAVATLVAATLSDEHEHRGVTVREVFQHQDRIFPWA